MWLRKKKRRGEVQTKQRGAISTKAVKATANQCRRRRSRGSWEKGKKNKRKMPQTSESNIGKISCVSVLQGNIETLDAGDSTES